MKPALLLAALCGLMVVTPAHAQTFFYNFEDIPSAYISAAGGTDLGAYYPQDPYSPYALVFGPGVQATYTSAAFPAHSGQIEIWQSDAQIANIIFLFGYYGAIDEPSTVSFWYTTLNGFTATAYGDQNQVIASIKVAPNTDGTTGTDSFLSLGNGSANDIADINIVDPTGVGGDITLDDLTVDFSVPDASSTFLLFGLAGAGLLAARKQFRVAPAGSNH